MSTFPQVQDKYIICFTMNILGSNFLSSSFRIQWLVPWMVYTCMVKVVMLNYFQHIPINVMSAGNHFMRGMIGYWSRKSPEGAIVIISSHYNCNKFLIKMSNIIKPDLTWREHIHNNNLFYTDCDYHQKPYMLLKSIWIVYKILSVIGIVAELYWLPATWWNQLFYVLVLNGKFMK